MKMTKEIACEVCPKTFSNRSNLSQHKQIHSGIKNYNCQQCKKSFIRNSDLKKHSLIHTGEKPHKCTQCDFSCNRLSSLKSHIKRHTGQSRTDAHSATMHLVILPNSHSILKTTPGNKHTSAMYVNIRQ